MAYTIMIDAGHGGPCTEIGHSLHFNLIRRNSIHFVVAPVQLTDSLNSLIKSERHNLTADNSQEVIVTVESESIKYLLSVYCDGGTPTLIDRYGIASSTEGTVKVHFPTALTADTRINVVYI